MRLTAVLLALLIGFTARAQSVSGDLRSFSHQGNSYVFQTTTGVFKLDFINSKTFRFRQDDGNTDSLMNTVYQIEPTSVKQTDNSRNLTLATTDISVQIRKAPFRITVFGGGQKLWSDDVDRGGLIKTKTGLTYARSLDADEHFFGFGERMDRIDRRANSVRLNVGRGKGLPHLVGAYNILEANYSPVPFFMSTKGYGIFLHNAYPSTWNLGSGYSKRLTVDMEGGKLDYYFFFGPYLTDVLSSYTNITGRSPLLPRFAYGLHVGTYSGGTWGHEAASSDAYVIELARKLRAMGIPADLLWLDSTWRIFGEAGGKGATSFEWRETFKNPQAMFDSVYALNFKMVGLHLRPRFDNGKKIRLLDTAQRLGYTFPENGKPGEFVNFFDKGSVDFWWDHGVMRTASIGAKFLKTDEGSAFGALANESDKTGPAGPDIARLHNLFPLAYAKAPYEKFSSFNKMRGLNQTREGWAGIQRYPYIFAGDWPSEWQYFTPVIRAGLNIGMSGVGHWSHCMGGFEHDADPELYIRWVQFGMFSPVALVFGMDHPGYKEPWNYGADALRNFRKYDSLRYALMPYIYTAAFEQSQTGLPMMRALPLVFQTDANTYNIDDEYMFGNDLLVCPVTTKGAQSRVVYLPEGSWTNFWTGEIMHGGKSYNVVCPLDSMPLFVRTGAAIPMQSPMQYVDERPLDTLVLEIFPGAQASSHLYEDDGRSVDAFQKNAFLFQLLEARQQGNTYSLAISKLKGQASTAVRTIRLRIHVPVKPLSVHVDGDEVQEFSFDSASKIAELTLPRFEQLNVEMK